MLEVKNLTKHYQHQLIIDIPTLRLEPGIYWLKGENGSGKTTFLKTIAALIPFKGDIFIEQVLQKISPVAYRKK